MTGCFDIGTPDQYEDRTQCLETIHALMLKKNALRSELKSEEQFNRKLELNIAVKRLQERIDALKLRLMTDGQE